MDYKMPWGMVPWFPEEMRAVMLALSGRKKRCPSVGPVAGLRNTTQFVSGDLELLQTTSLVICALKHRQTGPSL